MTYRELLEQLKQVVITNPALLDDTVTFQDVTYDDECFGIKTIVQIDMDHSLYGILDDHHLVLIPYRQHEK
ncbi:MAG TPA: hypothetical protein PL028_02160 [Bacteroidales bacterium]|nr:hypothetical protein [Bacteroidales bacterium]